jgi:methylated-DNA-[protein]-cysteine S-methyltransferase
MWTRVSSPIGDLVLVTDGSSLIRLGLPGERESAPPAGEPDTGQPGHPVLRAAAEQLAAYFAGELTDFDLPLSMRGSAFERRVWAELAKIPYGETCSYGDVARAVTGDVLASRAVGIANNHNPVAIIVPCHRVVGANGKLVGYGGGLPTKRFLLELEARVRLTNQGLLSF